MSEIIPLRPVPNQTLTVLLGGQNCRINVYQKFYGLYLDLAVGNVTKLIGVICQRGNRIVRYDYLGFVGDLVFFDMQGETEPNYLGLGGRYQLVYLEAADLVTG